jgi:hypothetical protein
MKSFKILLLALMAGSVLMLTNCSDDDNNNPNNNNGDDETYHPMKVGNYWVYENNDLDIEGNYVPDTFTMDSIVITSVENLYGKSSFKHVAYTKADEADQWEYDSETYFYSEGDKFYGLFDYIAPGEGLPLPLEFEPGWILLADPDATTSWIVFEQEFVDEDFEYGGFSLKVSGDFVVSIKKGASITFDNDGKPVSAKEYIISYKFDGTANLIIDFDLEFEILGHLWYAEGVGLVEYTVDPTSIGAATMSFDLDGNESLLERFLVQ